MGVLVAGVIAEVFHQRGGGVAYGERHGQIAGLTHGGQGGVDGHVGRVALGRGGKIYGALGQRDASFGHADLADHIECGVGQQQRVGVGEADILSRHDDQTTGDELRVLAPFDHSRQPVDGAVGVGAADALDEGRDDVVVHLSLLVVGQRILLQPFYHYLVVDHHRLPVGGGLLYEVEDIEELAGIAPREAEEGVGALHLHIALAEHLVGGDGAVEERAQLWLLQRFERVDLRTRQQRAYDLKRRILRGGADEGHGAIFHSA